LSQYFLTTEAQQSLESIKLYSVQAFGEKRTNQYLISIQKRLEHLAENPKQGKARTDLFNDWLCYSYYEGSHTIYYEIKSDHIIVIDVLHQSMDAELHLIKS
jgi:toxin ParE1/3/4